jgi:hypothetical protein
VLPKIINYDEIPFKHSNTAKNHSANEFNFIKNSVEQLHINRDKMIFKSRDDVQFAS